MVASTKTMQEAIEVLRELPEERRETVARAILDYASQDDGIYHLSHVERAEVRAGLVEIERGEIASDKEVQSVYKRIGL
jgi:predicted transcriptional regulator